MDKILLVIKREYLTRVRKRSFIVMTLLTPILFAGLIGALTWIAMSEEVDEKTIAVIDDSGLFKDKFQNAHGIKFVYLSEDINKAKNSFSNQGRDGLLYIPNIDIDNPSGIQLFSETNPHFKVTNEIENTLEQELERIKMVRLGIDQETLDNLDTHIELNTISLTSQGEKQSNANTTLATAYVSSLLIYFFLFLYGVQVMKGIIEEKYNRIVEVIISSIKPFQLMMGKILGIAAVGLTQFLLWVVLSYALISVGGLFMDLDPSAASAQTSVEGAATMDNSADMQFWETLDEISFSYVIGTFVVFFLGGYFLYAALFALVGSAVDSDADSQQFMFPITIPLIISIVALGIVLNDPDGSVAFWMSMIPLTSPVIMLGRIPFGVPAWQIALSLSLLVAGFIFTTWVAARVYRVGILMHGSKVNYKTLVKWFFQKN